MTHWLLTDELLGILDRCKCLECEHTRNIAKAQLSHIVEKLKEPCTEHFRKGIPLITTGIKTYAHRYLCPECLKELEDESK